jgi:hypothetical protein
MKRIESHYLTERERKRVAEVLYHEGLGWLNRREFVLNVPNLIGSPGEAPRVYAVIESVLAGTYRPEGECGREDCYLCHA